MLSLEEEFEQEEMVLDDATLALADMRTDPFAEEMMLDDATIAIADMRTVRFNKDQARRSEYFKLSHF